MSIQVEMPKWVSMDRDGTWVLWICKPVIITDTWVSTRDTEDSEHIVLPDGVSGYFGDWKDSLHQFVDGKWEKVK